MCAMWITQQVSWSTYIGTLQKNSENVTVCAGQMDPYYMDFQFDMKEC